MVFFKGIVPNRLSGRPMVAVNTRLVRCIHDLRMYYQSPKWSLVTEKLVCSISTKIRGAIRREALKCKDRSV